MQAGVDTVMGPLDPRLTEAVQEAQQRSGREIKLILTPWFNLLPGGDPANDAEPMIAACQAAGATICMPHQMVTDALMDRMYRKIREIDRYTQLIRQYEMIPGLSTHMPETIVYADETNADVETYIQIYNATGFLMQVETDWVMKIINTAKKAIDLSNKFLARPNMNNAVINQRENAPKRTPNSPVPNRLLQHQINQATIGG